MDRNEKNKLVGTKVNSNCCNNTNTSLNNGYTLVNNGSSKYISMSKTSVSIDWDTSNNLPNVIEYISFIHKLLSIQYGDIPDMEDFNKLFEEDKEIFIRDFKINEVLR